METLITAYYSDDAYICEDENGEELSSSECYFDDVLDQEYWDMAASEAYKVLDSKNYVEVSGTIRRWNGDKCIRTIIRETSLEDIIRKYIDPDRISFEVYSDRVEFRNFHHDGMNSYIFKPFDVNDFTVEELKSLFSEDDIEDFNDYSDEFHSFSRARKYELAEYADNYELFLDD